MTKIKIVISVLICCLAICFTGNIVKADEKEQKYDGKTLKEWVVLLSNGNHYTREDAFKILVKVGKPAVLPLIDGLKSSRKVYFDVSSRKALIKIGKPAVSALINLLKGKDDKVRENAIECLGMIGDKAAVPILIKIVEKEKEIGRKWKSKTVSGFRSVVKRESCFDSLLKSIKNIEMIQDNPRALQAVKNLSKNKDFQEMLKAIEKFRRNTKGKVFQDIRIIKKNTGKLRVEESITLNLDEIMIIPVTAKVKQIWLQPSEMCLAAVEALGKIGDKSAIPILKKALKEGCPMLRRRSAEALGKLGDTSGINALEKFFKENKNNLDVRMDIFKALYDIGGMAVVPIFINMLEEKKGFFDLRASIRLEQITGQSFGKDADKWRAWYKKEKSKTVFEKCLYEMGKIFKQSFSFRD